MPSCHTPPAVGPSSHSAPCSASSPPCWMADVVWPDGDDDDPRAAPLVDDRPHHGDDGAPGHRRCRGWPTYNDRFAPDRHRGGQEPRAVGNYFDGAWNKGEGGNGYVRAHGCGTPCTPATSCANLRPSRSSGRRRATCSSATTSTPTEPARRPGTPKLFELNIVRVADGHRPGNWNANCGGEGGADEARVSWYPVWWGAGPKAVKWSGATGPQNVYFNNTMSKQRHAGGEFKHYYPGPARCSSSAGTARATTTWRCGEPITDWAGRGGRRLPGGAWTRRSPTRAFAVPRVGVIRDRWHTHVVPQHRVCRRRQALIAEVGELERDAEVGALQLGDDRLQVVALLSATRT